MQRFINYHCIIYVMATITVSNVKQNGRQYKRYTMQLPKETMDRLMVESGDKLDFIGESANVLTFQFKRKDK